MKTLALVLLLLTTLACGSSDSAWKDLGDVGFGGMSGEGVAPFSDGGEGVLDCGEDTIEEREAPIEHACDDGNPCTTDAFYGNDCHFDAITYPLACGNAGRCWVGVCCDGGRCWDMPASACVPTCPNGKACNELGVCSSP